MCGIVGHVGIGNSADILIDGLRRLEYRGYDSSGIALLHDNDLFVEKAVGNNGIQFNGGGGESSTNFARSSSMASALNTLQSAELKYT